MYADLVSSKGSGQDQRPESPEQIEGEPEQIEGEFGQYGLTEEQRSGEERGQEQTEQRIRKAPKLYVAGSASGSAAEGVRYFLPGPAKSASSRQRQEMEPDEDVQPAARQQQDMQDLGVEPQTGSGSVGAARR